MARVGIRALADAMEGGESHTAFFFKSGSTGNGARWFDFSMAPGIPRYNAYVGSPLAFTPLYGSGNNGIYLGPEPTDGKKRVLTKVGVQCSNATAFVDSFLIADYLGFYPLIDGDNTDSQDLDNSVEWSRYASADNVHCMPVCYAAQVTDGMCVVTYTNSDGVSGRTSTFMLLGGNGPGSCVATAADQATSRAATPFIPLQSGDRGIRAIESVQMQTPVGGFVTLVLMKPLASMQTHELGTFCEKDLIRENGCVAPQIEPGAYINLLYTPVVGGSISPVLGYLEFTWRNAP